MCRLTKQVFIALLSFSGSLTSMAKISNFTRFISLNNQSCMTRPTFFYFNPDECNHGFRYYPFMVNLDRCIDAI